MMCNFYFKLHLFWGVKCLLLTWFSKWQWYMPICYFGHKLLHWFSCCFALPQVSVIVLLSQADLSQFSLISWLIWNCQWEMFETLYFTFHNMIKICFTNIHQYVLWALLWEFDLSSWFFYVGYYLEVSSSLVMPKNLFISCFLW